MNFREVFCDRTRPAEQRGPAWANAVEGASCRPRGQSRQNRRTPGEAEIATDPPIVHVIVNFKLHTIAWKNVDQEDRKTPHVSWVLKT